MAAHIRLKRTGKAKRPSYRIVVLDSRLPRDGAYLDCLGYYQPVEKEAGMKLDLQKLDEWIKKGAKVSNVVMNIARKIRKAS